MILISDYQGNANPDKVALHSIRRAITRKTNSTCWQPWEELVDSNVRAAITKTSVRTLQKWAVESSYWVCMYIKGLKSVCQRHLHLRAHCSGIHRPQKWIQYSYPSAGEWTKVIECRKMNEIIFMISFIDFSWFHDNCLRRYACPGKQYSIYISIRQDTRLIGKNFLY